LSWRWCERERCVEWRICEEALDECKKNNNKIISNTIAKGKLKEKTKSQVESTTTTTFPPSASGITFFLLLPWHHRMASSRMKNERTKKKQQKLLLSQIPFFYSFRSHPTGFTAFYLFKRKRDDFVCRCELRKVEKTESSIMRCTVNKMAWVLHKIESLTFKVLCGWDWLVHETLALLAYTPLKIISSMQVDVNPREKLK
jgi:hypothetical protein